MRSGVTVMSIRGSVCPRARESPTLSAALAARVTGALPPLGEGGQPTPVEGQEPLPIDVGSPLRR
jgi:hypothetical protein